jgi:MarR family transcriptional regulator, temperature-dependent positive regulator of motility
MKKSKQTSERSVASTLEDSPSHLLHRVLQIALDIYNAETGEGALTQRQYAVLKALDEAQTGSSVTQTDLVQSTGIDRSTLADMVTRMTTKGLLIREKSAADGRANLVSLSEAGKAALAEITPKVAAADAAILSLLSPPKRDSFVKLLRKVSQSRSEALADDTADAADKTGKKARTAKADKKADKKKKTKKPEKAPKKLKDKAETEAETAIAPEPTVEA